MHIVLRDYYAVGPPMKGLDGNTGQLVNRQAKIRSISRWCSRCQGLATVRNDHALGFTNPAFGRRTGPGGSRLRANQSLACRGIWKESRVTCRVSCRSRETPAGRSSAAARPWPPFTPHAPCHGSRGQYCNARPDRDGARLQRYYCTMLRKGTRPR